MKILNYIIAGRGRVLMLFKNILPWNNILFNYIRVILLKRRYDNAIYFSLNTFNQSEKSLNDHEFSLFSQNGEDGIFNHIFNKIGFTSRKSVEIGFGYKENNSLFLITKHNFESLLIDGQSHNVDVFNFFNNKYIKSKSLAVKSWITKDNINNTISEYIHDKQVDLLSIDIDGNDYWIWEAIDSIEPRVVILEYNASFYNNSITIPYDINFNRTDFSNEPRDSHWYHGASLKALTKVSQKKGYKLVGTDSKGVNCFFIRDEIIKNYNIKTYEAEEVFKPHYTRVNGLLTKIPMESEKQFEMLKDLGQ